MTTDKKRALAGIFLLAVVQFYILSPFHYHEDVEYCDDGPSNDAHYDSVIPAIEKPQIEDIINIDLIYLRNAPFKDVFLAIEKGRAPPMAA